MDKKTVVFFKKNFPGLFAWVVRSPWLAEIVSELDRVRYIYCLMSQKPYFGTVALAGQTWEERKPYMRRLLQKEIKDKEYFYLLEIGSWAGDSAVLWADTIKFAGKKGMVLCVDPWEPYIDEQQEKVNSATIIMNKALKRGSVFKLFLHNIQTSHHSDVICPLKGYSERVLPLLRRGIFNMVYIDGDHSYSGIKKDLYNAAKLIGEGGIIAGDDFDGSLVNIDRDYAEEHKEVNMVVDPKTKQTYHPGVCLAVSEFFGTDISSYCGFWAMRKVGDQWHKVKIDP
ncbi:MAG: class I SAM-dependent methyltransferase [Candidatus Omnitrophica bacterium]|nr:class I SAM-dependent methyltransferase [Candidatus Omnitrophota bacterium]